MKGKFKSKVKDLIPLLLAMLLILILIVGGNLGLTAEKAEMLRFSIMVIVTVVATIYNANVALCIGVLWIWVVRLVYETGNLRNIWLGLYFTSLLFLVAICEKKEWFSDRYGSENRKSGDKCRRAKSNRRS